MARRRISEIPKSRLAVWARRLALFALATTLLGTMVVRADLLEIVPALATVAGALALAGIAVLLALAATVVIWKDGLEGFGSALTAFVIGVGLLAYPAYLVGEAYQLPAINDITTDPDDPPQLEALARIRPRRGSNPATYPGAETAAKQSAAYPDIEPLVLPAAPQVVYETVYEIINNRKWRIIEARQPQPLPRRRDGHIEAVARTAIMGFRDDVVVRVRPDGDGSRVDVRSASRYGAHDIGTNAARVTALLEEIETAIDALPASNRNPEPPAPPTQPERPPRAKR